MAADRSDVFHGTLALMILTTLDGLGTLHGYGIARRIEQISGNQIELNQGTLYPALLKLEQIGWITSKWGVSENNRRARYYAISRAGRKQLKAEAANWSRATDIIDRFLKPLEDLA
jgi:PadR family transcriptional regulator PadR